MTAIGRAAQALANAPLGERLAGLLDATLVQLRDGLGCDLVAGILDRGARSRSVSRALLGSRLRTADSDRLISTIEPAITALRQALVSTRPLRSLVLTDLRSDPQTVALATGLGLQVLLVVPLISRQLATVVGVLVVGGQSLALSAQEMVRLVELIGSQLGTAISYTSAVEQLRASEERASLITEGAIDGIYILDPEGRFTYVNPQAEPLTGFTAEELLGQHFAVLVAPHDLARATETMRRAALGEALPDLYHLDLQRKDGSIRTVEISSRNLYSADEEGRFIGRFGIARDITERRRLEEELARRNRALEALNALATLAGRSSDLSAILDEALERTLAVFAVERGTIHLLDDASGDLVLTVAHGYSPPFLEAIARLPIDRGIPARVLTANGPVQGRNMADEVVVLADAMRAEDVRGFACVALRSSERVWGLLGISRRDEQLLSAADCDTLAVVGAQLGVAIENARLAAEAAAGRARVEEQAAQLSQLLGISAGFAANVALDDLLHTVTQAITATLGFGSAHARTLDAYGNMVGVGFHGYTADQIVALREPTPLAFYERLLDERFRIGGVYFIPHTIDRQTLLGDDWRVVRRPTPHDWQPGHWHPEDALVVPLRARDGALLGVIYVDEPLDGQIPDAGKVTVLELFGRQAALAIENANLYSRTRRDLRRQDAVRQVIEHISAELDRDRLLALILASAVDLLGGNAGAFGLVDETGGARITAVHNLPPGFVGQVLRPGQGLTGQVLLTGEPRLVDRYSELDAPLPELSFQSCLGVPICRGETLIGTFFVGSNDPGRRFGPVDAETLELFAKHAALALGNARLYEEARSQTARLQALREAIEQISSELDLPALLNRLAVSAVRLLDANSGAIALVDEDRGAARIEAGYHLPTGALGQHFMVGEGLAGLALARRAPVLIGPEDEQPRAATGAQWPGHAHIAVPIWCKDLLIGTFALSSNRAERRFTPDDLDTLSLLARHAAVAIENAGLYSALQERFAQVEGISAVGAALIEERNLDRVLRTVAEQIIALLDCAGCSIALLDPDEAERIPGKELAVVVVSGTGEQELPGRRLPLHGSFTGEAILQSTPLVVENLQETLDGRAPTLRAAGIDSILAVPLQTSERTVGALNAYGSRGRSFGPRDIETMALFAGQAAVAIENARLYEQGRTLAVAEERNRLAREIHDTLAQGFTGIILQLEVAQSLLEGDEPAARERLLKAQDLARASLQEARRSVWNLRPSPLQGRTLPEALRDYLRNWSDTTGIASAFSLTGGPRSLSQDTEETLLRIAQEALNNVHKHAAASQVDLRLAIEPGQVCLRVDDDGVGFTAPLRRGQQEGGFGLISMRERAGRLGGELTIESAPGRGTRVQLIVNDQRAEVRSGERVNNG